MGLVVVLPRDSMKLQKMNLLPTIALLFIAITYTIAEEECRDLWESWRCKESKNSCFNEPVRDFYKKHCYLTCGYCTAKPTPIPPHVGGCGTPDIKGIRIIAGDIPVRGSWPWQILMYNKGYAICGGTLIDPFWVVTATHCLNGQTDPDSFSIRVGEYVMRRDEGSEVDVKVEKIISHPNYDAHTNKNDISLFKLAEPVQFNKFVSPACLPAANVNPGTECYMTGWGQIRQPGYMTELLRQGKMPIVTNKVCQDKNKVSLGKEVTDGMICAGSGGSSLLMGCHGDSGGPLVCHVNGVWELHGTVSYGSKICSSKEAYTVFSRTFYYLPWIKEEMEKN